MVHLRCFTSASAVKALVYLESLLQNLPPLPPSLDASHYISSLLSQSLGAHCVELFL